MEAVRGVRFGSAALYLPRQYYLLRCERFEVSNANHTEEKLRIVEGHRWWHPAEIMASKDWFAPRDLGRHLLELIERGVPGSPIELERREES